MARLTTIGYETATLSDVIERLRAAEIAVLVDVRAVASSRRPGFSKTMLAASLEEAGIAYRHLRRLGTPKAGREAARSGRFAEMRAIFAHHLAGAEAQAELAQAIDLARRESTALLCYEADPSHCHRAIIADHISEAIGCDVEHLRAG